MRPPVRRNRRKNIFLLRSTAIAGGVQLQLVVRRRERLDFSGVSSSFSALPAGDDFSALLWVADQLSTELGYSEGDSVPETASPLRGRGAERTDLLGPEEEQLVVDLGRALARVAAALEKQGLRTPPENAVNAALYGAELVLRGELMNGNGRQLVKLMPSFVFIVALPIVEQDRALELSRRTEELVEDGAVS